MKRHLLIALALTTTVMGAEFFVAPDGKDSNPGTAAQPFATFLRSRQAVRAQRAAGASEAVTVTFKAGRYELGAPLDFDVQDSGASAEQPVTYRAEKGAEVEISGGRRITGWQKDPQRPGVWKTRVRESNWDDQSWRYEQLWVNGQRAIRARTPNYWQFNLLLGVTEAPGAESGRMTHTFAAKPKDLATLRGLSPEVLRDAQVMVFHKWDTTREWLDTVSPEEGVFTTRGAKMQGWNAMTRDCLYYFENYLAALDAPGEWFLDRDGWLYYMPRPGEDMANAEVVAPTIPAFVTIRGTVDQPDRWVKHLRFEGLKFRHAEFRTPRAGIPPAQAAMNLDATAVLADGAQDIRFANCAVEHIGSTAFWFRKACRDCRVEGTRMYDVGIEGVRIGEPQIVPEAARTGGITIDNCIIQSGGRIAPHTVAVWIGHSSDNAITHCDVADFFYTAISVGWRWGYDESAAKRNRIEFNHLHHLGYRILSDMGGVYTLGPSEGTRVCNNVIHDVYSTRYGGWGLYPDEGSTGILLENNLVYDVRDGCVHQHYGKENIFLNNILAFSEEGQVAVTRAEPHLSFTFEHNLVYWDAGYLLGYSGWKGGAKVVLRNNLYWRAGDQPFDFAGKTWEQWRAAGNDEGSLIADPLFVDAAKRDFRLRPDSPAGKIGFKPFDFTQAGVYGDPAWKRLASSVTFPKPYVVPGPEPLSLRDDFEGKSPNSLLAVASLETENHPELIAVTTEVAASGTHSLRIKDRAGLKQAYNPHFYWDPNYTKGRARMAFRIRLEPGANVHCEWRSQGHPYTAGPSLHFHDKVVTARGKQLDALPENAWIGVEIRAPLGLSDSKYDVTFTLPDGTKQEAKGLPSDPAWKEARWVGFSSNANAETAYELDDLEMVNE